jgi:tubulin alpha
MTNNVFDSNSAMVSLDPRRGKYMSCCLMYHGDIIPHEVIQAIRSVRTNRTVNFVDWVPTGFKVGINENYAMSYID